MKLENIEIKLKETPVEGKGIAKTMRIEVNGRGIAGFDVSHEAFELVRAITKRIEDGMIYKGKRKVDKQEEVG